MQIRSTSILSSPCSPNPFTTFLPIEVGGKEFGHRRVFVPIASIESQRLLPLHTPSNSLPSFRCPTLGGTRRGTSTRFRKEAVSSLGGGWLSRVI